MNFFLVILDAPFQRAEKLCKIMTNFLHYKIFCKKFSKKITFQPFYINEKEEDWMIAAEYTDHSSA